MRLSRNVKGLKSHSVGPGPSSCVALPAYVPTRLRAVPLAGRLRVDLVGSGTAPTERVGKIGITVKVFVIIPALPLE